MAQLPSEKEHNFGVPLSSFASRVVVPIPAKKRWEACLQIEDTCVSCELWWEGDKGLGLGEESEFVRFLQPMQLICNDRASTNSTAVVCGCAWGHAKVQANVQLCLLRGD